MEKTPIMILQELTMKFSMCVPVYTEISNIVGTHRNEFIIGVKWQTYSATGAGRNKKEAKQNAAKEMLSLLLSSGQFTERKLSTYKNQSNFVNIRDLVIPAPTNVHGCISSSLDSSNASSVSLSSALNSASESEDEFTNYVGLLMEFCTSKEITYPQFDVVNTSGPPHMRTFTMSCTTTYGRQEASAKCKKYAKQKAAKLMLQLLKERTNFKVESSQSLKTYADKLDLDFMNLSIDEPPPNKSATEKALATYKQLVRRDVSNKNEIPIKDMHHAFTNLCQNIPQAKKAHLINVYREKKEDVNSLKHSICSVFQTVVEKVLFRTNNESQFMIGLKLPVWPTIFQIGAGNTMKEAEKEALHKIFEMIFIFCR